MTPAEHAAEAERLVAASNELPRSWPETQTLLLEAQVHATLSLRNTRQTSTKKKADA